MEYRRMQIVTFLQIKPVICKFQLSCFLEFELATWILFCSNIKQIRIDVLLQKLFKMCFDYN